MVQFAGANKPVKAAVAAIDDPGAIRDGFASPGKDYEPLADAAVCRSGIRLAGGHQRHRDAMTAFNSKSGGFQLTTVGRVQTPTLAIMVEREEKIRLPSTRLLGSARDVCGHGGRLSWPLVRREIQEVR